jgi:hypothetical protein
MKKHEAFYIGVGVGYLLEEYGGDLWYALACEIRKRQRRAEIERARVVDVFGDEIK